MVLIFECRIRDVPRGTRFWVGGCVRCGDAQIDLNSDGIRSPTRSVPLVHTGASGCHLLSSMLNRLETQCSVSDLLGGRLVNLAAHPRRLTYSYGFFHRFCSGARIRHDGRDLLGFDT